ncbi:MAG: 1-deoxy-D-xylulose-5-phosphate reductoisomerase, partial [Clostridia bacterium]|nr:1-deoxy-D-xylulose-5-phosphate reductoisomerase [Clostridia bacterium]
MMKKISVLGSTGSIGKQTLEVIEANPDSMRVLALSGGRNAELLIEQARRFQPKYVANSEPLDASLLPKGVKYLCGPQAAEQAAALPEADAVVNGISGFAAFKPLLAALGAGKRVALANKESVVCGGALIDRELRRCGGQLLPVDSEQSAIFQCLHNGRREETEALILTASGGPFWREPLSALESVTPEQALRHPTWRMGNKITIDSATLFNKGLEILEAAYLFHFNAEQISVLIHPESIVHSMVAYRDGTVMANLSRPDMRLPIQYALTYPERRPSPVRPLSLTEIGGLHFHEADMQRFAAIRLAFQALRAGGSMPIAYNAANEVAVSA